MDNEPQVPEPQRKWDGNPFEPLVDAEFDALVAEFEREGFKHEH